MTDQALSQMCNAVMVAVANMIKSSGKQVADYDQACQCMRGEVKAFFFGAEYADERDCIMRGSIHQNVVLASVALSAFNKIKLS